MGKGEIACTSNFSFIQQCFQKASFSDPSKGVIVWEWVDVVTKNQYNNSETLGVSDTKLPIFLCPLKDRETDYTHWLMDRPADSIIPVKRYFLQEIKTAKI